MQTIRIRVLLLISTFFSSAAAQWSDSDLKKCLCWDSEKNNWCKGSDQWDQCEDYWNTYAPYVIIALFGAGVILVGIFAYYITRCLVCCNRLCCKGVGSGISKTTLSTYRVLLVLCFITLVVTVGVSSHYRADDVHDGLQSVNTSFTTQTNALRAVTSLYMNTTYDLLEEVGYPSGSVPFNITTAITTVNHNVDHWMHNVNNKQHDIMSHLWVLDMFLWPSLITTALLLVFNMLKIHRVVPEIMVFFVFITALAAFFLQFTVGASRKASIDLCDDYEPVADQVIKIIDSKIGGCGEEGRLGGIITSTVFIQDSYITESCKAANVSVGLLCSKYFTCDTCDTLDGVASVLANGSVLTDGASLGCVGCSISQCAEKCTDSEAKTLSSEAVQKDSHVRGGLATLKKEVYPVADCSYFKSMFMAGRPAICGDFKPSTKDYFVTVGVAGVFAMVVFIFATLANYMYVKEQELHVYEACTVYPTNAMRDEATPLTQKETMSTYSYNQ
eukprot:TRINITY_DN23_c0_g2_i4.p1 TRINITY_DN23_c0_g2~~TRINITY_DN23_c0_g2_i4.p1  ORF type:complete len:501 (+),score=147.68 TRINITY_DN23_c0_g2_i4:74-1576(+)